MRNEEKDGIGKATGIFMTLVYPFLIIVGVVVAFIAIIVSLPN